MAPSDSASTGQAVTLARVLVALDGSKPATQALPFAAAIAGSSAGAEIVLLEVVPHASNVRNILGREIAPAGRVQEGYAKVAEERLAAAAATLPSGVSTKTLIKVGDPAEEILSAAGAERVDLIAMTGSGGGAWGPFAFGRVVDRVVRAATRPVLVVPARPAGDGGGGKASVSGIVVPIDGSEAALAALPVAAALAKALGAPIRVIQAVALRPDDVPPVSPDIAHPDTIEREFRGATEAAARTAVDAAVARLKALGVTASGDVLTGEPVSTVISEAERTDLVVLTSRGEGRRSTGEGPAETVSWRLGGVADKLIRAGTAPVVLVPAT